MDSQLSPHFFLREFLRSETAARMGRQIEDPPIGITMNLSRLAVEILEPLRVALNRPISILSGWRPLWLNTAVGGSKTSDHMQGCAADFEIPGMKNGEVCRLLQASLLPIKQCILEFPPNGWVHVSIGAPGVPPKREFITATKVGKTTIYSLGIRD